MYAIINILYIDTGPIREAELARIPLFFSECFTIKSMNNGMNSEIECDQRDEYWSDRGSHVRVKDSDQRKVAGLKKVGYRRRG
jgi:hypothetical protein